MPETTVRGASADDVRAVLRRRKADAASLQLAFESAEQGTAWAAFDDGEAIGLAVAHCTDGERYVGDLFVEPSYRGAGVGGKLLDTAFADAGDAARAMAFDPSDAAALALALRRGLSPRATVARMAGSIPREEGLMVLAAGDYRFTVDAIDPEAHAYALNALDRETRGVVRPDDHARFATNATGQAFFLNGEFVAYAYVWPDGRIGPLASSSVAYLVQIFGFVLVTLARTHGASWCSALVPTANVRIARAALRAGLQIEQTFSLAGDAPPPDLANYVGYHQFQF